MNRNDIIKVNCPIERIGNDKGHHFFGYYNKSVWDQSNRFILANRFNKMVKDVQIDDALEIGFYDTENNAGNFNKVGSTTSWNWQMGNQTQWLDGLNGKKVIFNIRAKNPSNPYPEFCSQIVDIENGESQNLSISWHSLPAALCDK